MGVYAASFNNVLHPVWWRSRLGQASGASPGSGDLTPDGSNNKREGLLIKSLCNLVKLVYLWLWAGRILLLKKQKGFSLQRLSLSVSEAKHRGTDNIVFYCEQPCPINQCYIMLNALHSPPGGGNDLCNLSFDNQYNLNISSKTLVQNELSTHFVMAFKLKLMWQYIVKALNFNVVSFMPDDVPGNN